MTEGDSEGQRNWECTQETDCKDRPCNVCQARKEVRLKSGQRVKNGNSQKFEGSSGFEELFIGGHEKKLDGKMGGCDWQVFEIWIMEELELLVIKRD